MYGREFVCANNFELLNEFCKNYFSGFSEPLFWRLEQKK